MTRVNVGLVQENRALTEENEGQGNTFRALQAELTGAQRERDAARRDIERLGTKTRELNAQIDSLTVRNQGLLGRIDEVDAQMGRIAALASPLIEAQASIERLFSAAPSRWPRVPLWAKVSVVLVAGMLLAAGLGLWIGLSQSELTATLRHRIQGQSVQITEWENRMRRYVEQKKQKEEEMVNSITAQTNLAEARRVELTNCKKEKDDLAIETAQPNKYTTAAGPDPLPCSPPGTNPQPSR